MSATLLDSMNSEILFAHIYDDSELVGDVTLFPNGSATVLNAYSGIQQWFDNPATGHEDAMRYIKTRMAPEPVFR